MPISDDTVMAYVDGELDAAARDEVQRAIAADAALAERVRRQTALRQRLQGAFAPVLAEPMPERLLRAAQAPLAAPAPPKVASLAEVRAAKASRRAWASDWKAWGGMAASVLVGVLIGQQMSGDGAASPFAMQSGQLVAGGAVAQALSTQLASAPAADTGVQVQLSFVDKSGAYCRTFTSAGLAGLACHSGAQWAVQSLAQVEPGAGAGMRQAATALPPTILGEIDRRIQGGALDAEGERAALQRGWRQ